MVTEEITMVIDDPLREIGRFEQPYLYYRYADSTPRPTVLIFPLFGDDIWVDKLAAKHFWRKGFNTLIVISQETLGDHSRPLSRLNNVLTRYTIVARMSIDMMEGFPETDPARIFGYGMSMGGIRTAWAFGVDPRIRKVGIVAAGGDVAGMITDTDYDTLADTRDARMIAENLPDRASFRAYLNEALTTDPTDFACLRHPEDVIMVMSSNDNYVRNVYQEKLYDAFSRPGEGRYPGLIRSPIGHMQTGALFHIYVNRLAEFFHAPLKTPPADDPAHSWD
jgi:hypothetical protein